MGRCRFMNYLLLLVQVHMLLAAYGKDLTTWLAQDNCGVSISLYKTAGALRLEAEHLLTTGGVILECQLTVAPSSLPGSGKHGRVLFYFTEFNLTGPCSSFAVTVTGSSLKNGPYVEGQERTPCNYNTDLTKPETVFTTIKDSFDVKIRWKTYEAWPPGGFLLKFASFYDGPCEDSGEVVTCANKRCTASEFHCHSDIRTCGSTENKVCGWETLEEDSETLRDGVGDLGNFIKIVSCIAGAIFVVAIIVVVTWKILMKRKSQGTARPRSPADNPAEPQTGEQTRLNVPNEEDHSNRNRPYSDGRAGETVPPSYNTVTPRPSVTPSAPPLVPSAPEDLPPPSYEDYICNEIMYK